MLRQVPRRQRPARLAVLPGVAASVGVEAPKLPADRGMCLNLERETLISWFNFIPLFCKWTSHSVLDTRLS